MQSPEPTNGNESKLPVSGKSIAAPRHVVARNLPKTYMRFFWWMRHILFLWVKTKVIPTDPLHELGIDPAKPVCYILNYRSLSDLLVLDETCERLGMPRSHNRRKDLNRPNAAGYIYLQKLGLVQVERDSGKEPPSPLSRLIRMSEADRNLDIQLVPVTVLWGRNPGKNEKSIFKLLFFGDEHAGVLQKFFIVLAQGRGCFLQFGTPISVRQQVEEAKAANESTEQTAKKLRRVLRVHFKRQRIATMGPSLPTRRQVIGSLMQAKPIRTAIQEESRKKKISLERAEGRARRYLMEIAADTNYSMVRLFDIFLTWVWNRIFDGVVVKHVDRVREQASNAEVVYLPSHRSHMDYLLLSYILYYEGLFPPHIAAGVNLNFWPAGYFMRRAGAFFIRRSFGSNRLYAAVFNEYIHYVLTKGHPLKFYLEGGRSRTGRLLNPKTGMLAMVVQSYLRDHNRPVVFLPVFLGYDKVPEVRTYQTELRGKAKVQESIGGLLKARRIFKSKFGKAYIGFGEPLVLGDFLDEWQPTWREQEDAEEAKPKWMHPVVSELAHEVLTRVNNAAVVSPVAIFSLVILSSPQRAMGEDELLMLMDKFLSAMRAAPYGRDVALPDGDAKSMLQHCMQVCKIERFAHPGGDVIYLEEREGVQLTYYRNNILHLVALPALIASFFQHNDRIPVEKLIASCSQIYPFLKTEFFLRFDDTNCHKVISNIIDALVNEGLLVMEDGELARPDLTSKEFACLKTLGRALGQTLERYAISAALLSKSSHGGRVDRKEFETQCQMMAQRISILSGANEPEHFDKSLFKNYIDLLKSLGYVEEDSNGQLNVDPRLVAVSANSLGLLSMDIRQSIERITLTADRPAEKDQDGPSLAK